MLARRVTRFGSLACRFEANPRGIRALNAAEYDVRLSRRGTSASARATRSGWRSGDGSVRAHRSDGLVGGPSAMGGIQELADAHGRHRPAEQIALRFGDRAVDADQLELLVGF